MALSSLQASSTQAEQSREPQGFQSRKEWLQWFIVLQLVFGPWIYLPIIQGVFARGVFMADGIDWFFYTLAGLALLALGATIWLYCIHYPKRLRLYTSVHAAITNDCLVGLYPEKDFQFQVQQDYISLTSKRKRSALWLLALWGFLSVGLYATYQIISFFEIQLLTYFIGLTWILMTIPQRLKSSFLDLKRDSIFLPSLTISDEGITATYSKHDLTIRWQDIRYFAVRNDFLDFDHYTAERLQKLYKKRNKNAIYKTIADNLLKEDRELYEISDGQQVITWFARYQKDRKTTLYHPTNGELKWSEYDDMMDSIAARIIETTGLPLQDARQYKQPITN